MSFVSSVTSWISAALHPRDSSEIGPAGTDAADSDHDSGPTPKKVAHVSPSPPKRASMPDTRGRASVAATIHSTVLAKSRSQAAKFKKLEDDDPIEDHSIAPVASHKRSENTRITRKSHVEDWPRPSSTNGEAGVQAKTAERDAVRLLGDKPSKRENDEVPIPLPGISKLRDMQQKTSFSGPYKPVNTLNGQQRGNSREDFLNRVTATSRRPATTPLRQTRLHDSHYQDASASKRRRTSKAPTGTVVKSGAAESRLAGHQGSQLQNEHISSLHDAISHPPAMKEQPIEIPSDEEEDEYFTKQAKLQREQDLSSDTEMISSPRIGAHPTKGTTSPYFTKSSGSGSTPPRLQEIFGPRRKTPILSNAVTNGEESPDALQSNEVTCIRDRANERQTWGVASGSSIAGQVHDIQPESSRRPQITNKTKPKGKNAHLENKTFPIRGLRFREFPHVSNYIFVFDQQEQTFALNYQDQLLEQDRPVMSAIKVSKINRFLCGGDPSARIIVYLRGDHTKGAIASAGGVFMGLELESHRAVYDLSSSLAKLGVKVEEREPDWVDKIYDSPRYESTVTSRERLRQPVVEIKRPKAREELAESPRFQSEYSSALATDGERKRLAGLGIGQPAGQIAQKLDSRRETIVTSAARIGNSSNDQNTPRASQEQRKGAEDLDDRVQRKPMLPPRPTRSTRAHYFKDFDDEALEEAKRASLKPKFSETGGLGPRWKEALVYPKTGKKRETVSYDDLPRLDDDEFLNDSLIGFFLVYLEHNLEEQRKEDWKKSYFFNSYFYDRLTQAQKGRRGINYDGVDKWTRNIDLFSRDFVVVPVNENLHWYVAIIYNLTYFGKIFNPTEEDLREAASKTNIVSTTHAEDDKTQSSHEESAEIDESNPQVVSDVIEADVIEVDEDTRSSFQNMHLDEVDEKAPPTPVQSSPADRSGSQSKKRRGRAKFARKSLPKYDPEQPMIITLDSLGSGRSATCTALRQYIKLEALHKRGWEIDESEIKGMTAKDIPTQGNYSDCGLYLCAYLEQFALDPYRFVYQILQRQDQGWPKMESGDLRSRFRALVMGLHREQEGKEPDTPIPDVGHILLGEVSNLKAGQLLEEVHDIPASRSGKDTRPVTERESSVDDLFHVQTDADADANADADADIQIRSLSQAERHLNRPPTPVAISDDEKERPEVLSSRQPWKKDYSRKRARRQSDAIALPEDPKEFARELKQQRSPQTRQRERLSPSGAGEAFHNALQRAEIHTKAATTTRREASASTDYLVGSESYAQQREELEDAEELAEEVPETQQAGRGSLHDLEPDVMLLR